ncbi:peptidoglycan/LPS O-acetylase OafA/YrhL [Paenibacillus sacheonensis]|nr:peptidoglycan/LPS O-acetylase OafA/YrhL [Paenibacillus sacheonensis]
MPQTTTRYMPGLDGLRAIAVLAVIAYHFGWSIASGGLLGVEFFSSYPVT